MKARRIKSIILDVTGLDPEICFRLRDARRLAKQTQSAVAREIGCKQSALSMFEMGDGTKLNDETVEKLCARFGIEKPSPRAATAGAAVAGSPFVRTGIAGKGFCPNPACPSHHGYYVAGRMLLEPDRARQDPAGGTYCAVCGEVLERKCPSCGAAVHDGAICSFCGKAYVASGDGEEARG